MKRIFGIGLIVLVVAAIAWAGTFETVGGMKVMRLDNVTVTTDAALAVAIDTSTGTEWPMEPVYSRYGFVFRCLSLSNLDSTYVRAIVSTKAGDSDAWTEVWNVTLMDSGEVWKHFNFIAAGDTALASGGHFGNRWRVDYFVADSTTDSTRTVKAKLETSIRVVK